METIFSHCFFFNAIYLAENILWYSILNVSSWTFGAKTVHVKQKKKKTEKKNYECIFCTFSFSYRLNSSLSLYGFLIIIFCLSFFFFIINCCYCIFSIHFSLGNFEHGFPVHLGLHMFVHTMGIHILVVHCCLRCFHWTQWMLDLLPMFHYNYKENRKQEKWIMFVIKQISDNDNLKSRCQQHRWNECL